MNKTDLRGITIALASSALTCAAAAETVHDSTVLMAYVIDGKFYSKSGTNADQATPTTDAATGVAFPVLTANKGAVMVWGYDASAVVKCVMGEITALDAAGNFVVAPEFPANIPDTICPFAYQILKAGATAGTITFGTSNWNATGFTNTIVNVATLPSRPQVA